MRKPYIARQPFKNNTGCQVGQLQKVNGKSYIITAIVYNTPKTAKIYGLVQGTPMKLDEYKEYQRRRELGQVKIYLPGTHILTVNNDHDTRV